MYHFDRMRTRAALQVRAPYLPRVNSLVLIDKAAGMIKRLGLLGDVLGGLISLQFIFFPQASQNIIRLPPVLNVWILVLLPPSYFHHVRLP